MELSDKIHLLRIDFEINIAPSTKIPRFVNVLILFGKKITFIDTGAKCIKTVIFDYISKQGQQISVIETIILSHSHPGHIGETAKIKELTNSKVIAHKQDQEWIENIEE
jgi:hydroxyacylglutathione hydrolase